MIAYEKQILFFWQAKVAAGVKYKVSCIIIPRDPHNNHVDK